ncbi:S-protein homologue 1 [Hibiscus trionum]|uniref:S-protein homolog n=1 Tax=Hibiscus trionum TaxID=183268 RepID=A0A9W7IRE8_HIBTR|nr:S-protein homologue 1 [Hibiscus trionum]
MSSFFRNMYFFLVLATLMATNPSTSTSSAPTEDQRNMVYKTWHVHAVNGLSSNKILFVHCKSRDDDLGIHNLTVGNEFQWKFKPTIFGKTLFWCFMASDSDHVHASFNVFWDDQDLFYRCNWKNCFWIGKDDGIYLKNIPENYDEFKHKWESGRGFLANYTIV